MQRPITKQEEVAYRLCHHDLDGLSTEEAAAYLRISKRRVEQLLASLGKKAPQLFPVLTQTQARDYHLYVNEGWSLREIMEDTGRAVSTISESITAAIKKGMPPVPRKRGMKRYNPGMDSHVKEKF